MYAKCPNCNNLVKVEDCEQFEGSALEGYKKGTCTFCRKVTIFSEEEVMNGEIVL